MGRTILPYKGDYYPKVQCPKCGRYYSSNAIERHRRDFCGISKEDVDIKELAAFIAANVKSKKDIESAIRKYVEDNGLVLTFLKSDRYKHPKEWRKRNGR